MVYDTGKVHPIICHEGAGGGRRDIATIFPQPWRYRGWVVNTKPRPIYSRKWPRTHWLEGWTGPRAALDGYEKSRPPPGFDPQTVQPIASRNTDYACSLYRTIIGISEPVPWRLSSWILRFILMPPTDNAPRLVNLIFMFVRSYVCSRKGRRYLGSDKTWHVAARHSAPHHVWQYTSHYSRMSVYVFLTLQYPALGQQSPRNRRRTLVVPTVLCGSQGIRDQFPGDPWMHFSNGY
jgi:hypothetical protein